jgi:putative ABC transport system permease protein
MGALWTALLAHLRQRKLQATVIGLVLFLSSASAALALNDALEAQAPFQHTFDAANGAHLVIDFEASLTDEQLAATVSASGVTASAGPWEVAPAALTVQGRADGPGGGKFVEFGSISDRDDPSSAVDRVTISRGRWWAAPGEVVVSQAWAARHEATVGDSISVEELPPVQKDAGGGNVKVAPGPPNLADRPMPGRTLVIVGVAGSVSTPGVAAWMSPADLEAVTAPEARSAQMLYRVNPSATAADLGTASATITASLPTDAVDRVTTYRALQRDVDRTAAVFIPILLAFSAFGLLAAAFLIANAVSGIVLASYRQIGIMKAVGYTPGGITGILEAEILLPAAIGSIAGVVAGTIASLPVLDRTARSFGLPAAGGPDVTLLGGLIAAALAVTGLAALGPALMAGRISTVEAMTRGTTPSRRHRSGWASRLPLPLPVVRGLDGTTAHPLRTAMTFGALTVGVAAVVFAMGLQSSMHLVAKDLVRDETSPVRIDLRGAAEDAAAVSAAIRAQPETGHWAAVATEQVSVARLGRIPFAAYDGEADDWMGYQLISGRWFSAPGEAVAPTNVFRSSGLAVGDRIMIGLGGRTMTVTLVGEIFDQADEGDDDLVLRGPWADLAALDPGLTPDRWEVSPVTGVSGRDYLAALALPASSAAGGTVANSDRNETFLLFEGAAWLIAVVLLAVSIGGVLITVLLETRHRAREIAIYKTLGMTPHQVMATVLASVLPAGLAAGVVGVPAGLVLQRIVIGLMGDAASHTGVPDSVFSVFAPAVLLGFLGLGVLIGAAGAILPARRAAAARIAPVLQAE